MQVMLLLNIYRNENFNNRIASLFHRFFRRLLFLCELCITLGRGIKYRGSGQGLSINMNLSLSAVRPLTIVPHAQGWFDPSQEDEEGIKTRRILQLDGYVGPEGLLPPTFVVNWWKSEISNKSYFLHDARVSHEERNGTTVLRGGMRMKCRHTRGRWCGRYER